MADQPAWAKPAPAWAKAPAKPAPPAPKEQPGVFSRFVQGASDVASGAFLGVENAIKDAPKNIAPARREIVQRANQSLPAQARGYVDDVKKSWDRDVTQPYNQMKEDWNKPLDKTKGILAVPARLSHTAIQAAGLAPGAVQALVASGLGRTIQGVTGIDKEAAGLLGSMVIPIPLGKGLKVAAGGATRPLREGMQRTFAPETISETARDTASLHRAAHGIRRGQAAAENYALERHQRVVTNASKEDQVTLAKYVDTRSTGSVKLPAKLQPAADAMKGVYTRYRARIENVLGTDGPKFVKDYYARMWANTPEEVEKALQGHSVYGSKQGSGRNLRKRSIPTYEEGLSAGLTPKFHNPIDATNAYVDNMATYLATHETLGGMRKTGLAKWAFENKVPKGMVKLEGIGTTKPAMLGPKGQLLVPRVLVAPEDAARVFNRTASKGLDQGAFGGLYRGARTASNAVTQVKLGLSAFHATVMGEEGIVSAFSEGLKQVSKGDIGGLKSMALAPAAPFKTASKGGALRRAILDPDNAATHLKGMDPKLAELYQRSGGRVGMDRFYSTGSVSGGFWRGIKNGTLTRDVSDALARAGKSPIKGSLELTGKLLDTVSAPIFKEYVPRMKAGAWASQMEQWLKENPEANAVERQRYGEDLVNNMDNRFGELIQDNQFWHKAHFQTAQLLMLSPSWNFGTVREIGGGLAELPASVRGIIKGKGITDKTAYVAALGTTFMIQNGMATYLHTGQMPEGQDWLAYRTGGTDKNGDPERGLIPGYMKDVLAFGWNFPHHVITEMEGKGNPALATASQLITNKDHFDKPVYNPNGGVLEQMGEGAKYTAGQLSPISLSQPSRGPDSGFTAAESAMGIRKAPAYLENPDRVNAMDEKYGGRAWQQKLKADRKKANREAAPASAPSDAPPWVSAAKADTPAPSWAADSAPDWAKPAGAAVKSGATGGGDVRPEFKPVVDFVSRLPGVDRITAENDTFHPASDVHGQGRAMDFTIKGGQKEAAAFASRLRQRLHAEGYSNVQVLDEYNRPSRGATGGHIHIAYR